MRLLLPSGLLARTTNKLLGKAFALVAPLAFKLGVTQRVLLTLIGITVAVVVVLALLAAGLLGSFGGG